LIKLSLIKLKYLSLILLIFSVSCSNKSNSPTGKNKNLKDKSIKSYSKNKKLTPQNINPKKIVHPKSKPSPKQLIPKGLICLKEAYPDFIKSVSAKKLTFKDGTNFKWNRGIHKLDFTKKLNTSDLKVQMSICYNKGFPYQIPIRPNHDPGRFRNTIFFDKMYGSSKAQVSKNLVKIKWMKTTYNQSIYITTINGVHNKLKSVSQDLEQLPKKFRKYLKSSGAFNYRKITGTKRKSPHSYGIAIDIGIKHADYWKWNKNRKKVTKNRIPLEIIEIFEKHGFIWGGKWFHFDTMHFEYRPELLTKTCNCPKE
jgi:peptidoglycan LD-endopeptidase CwlK